MDDDTKITQITLRLPRHLQLRLTEAAERNSRSQNAEIISRLEASFNSVEERLAALEEEVFHPKMSLEEVRGTVEEIERELNRGMDRLERQIEAVYRSIP